MKSKFKIETTALNEHDDNDDLLIDSLETNQLNSSESKNVLFENVKINNDDIMFKLDSGAECNIIPTRVHFHFGSVDHLSSARVTLLAFGRKMVKVRGSVR